MTDHANFCNKTGDHSCCGPAATHYAACLCREAQFAAIISAAQECFAIDDCGLIFWGKDDQDAPADKLQAALEAAGAKFRRMKI